MDWEYKNAVAIAFSVVLAYTAYLALLGYELTFETQPGWGKLLTVSSVTVRFHAAFVYVPALFLLGVGFGVAYTYGFLPSLGVGGVSLLAYPWVRPVGMGPFTNANLFGLAGDLLFLSVAYTILVATEAAIRQHSTFDDIVTLENIRIGTVAGVLHFGVVVFIRNVVWGGSWGLGDPSGFVVWIWITVGLILGMLIPVALLLQYRVVTPTVVVISILVVAAVSTFSGPGPQQSITPTLLSIYMVFWFVPLLLGLLSGSVEYAIRTRKKIGV